MDWMSTQRTAPFLREVRIRNFKSISKCAVGFAPVTLLVGRNGAGKSNFLDALQFVTEGLQTSLDHAIRSRGGIESVRRRSTGHPRNFAIELVVSVSGGLIATYSFEIAARSSAAFAVKREELVVTRPDGSKAAFYSREEAGLTESSLSDMPPVLEDRLYLVNAAGRPEFRSTYDALLSMGFYNLNPDAMKEPQSPDAGELLHGDGANIASVVGRLSRQQPEALDRISTYLSTIVPGVGGFESVTIGPRETLMFNQRVEGSQHPWKFYATSMSDGTLRALGALVAVGQLGAAQTSVKLIGLEEPETALHPAAAGALMDALREASTHTQVIATTHSPDLLAELDLERDGLLVVTSRDGNTRIGPIDPASIEAVKQHLYSPGELLRLDQLQPDEADLARQEQLPLFALTPA
jgi:predicted ATPase